MEIKLSKRDRMGFIMLTLALIEAHLKEGRHTKSALEDIQIAKTIGKLMLDEVATLPDE
jgi:hypothetical protein